MLNVHMESRTRELNILQERDQNMTDVQSKLETALEKSRQVISFYLKMTSCDTLHYLRPGIGNDTGKVPESEVRGILTRIEILAVRCRFLL